MQIVLETERLTVRQLLGSDLDALVELDSDPAVMQFINGGRPTARSVIEDRLLPMYQAHYAAGDRYGRWAAIETASDAFVGILHLRAAPDRPDEEPELGYRLRRSAWGRGYATEGCRALIDKGFAEWGARLVVAQTMVANLASRRVLDKLGMKPVRHFRMEWPDEIAGAEYGDVEYVISRPDWEAQRP